MGSQLLNCLTLCPGLRRCFGAQDGINRVYNDQANPPLVRRLSHTRRNRLERPFSVDPHTNQQPLQSGSHNLVAILLISGLGFELQPLPSQAVGQGFDDGHRPCDVLVEGPSGVDPAARCVLIAEEEVQGGVKEKESSE